MARLKEALLPGRPLHPVLANFLAGGVAGGSGVIAGQPLDTVRIRMQQPGVKWPSAVACLRAITATEGPAALFRGTWYPLLTISLQNALVFQTFGAAVRALAAPTASLAPHQRHDVTHTPTIAQTCAAGMAAGVVQTSLVAPVELLKIRQQLQTAPIGTAHYVGPWRLLRTILATEGLRGLYRGGGITLARDIPAHGVYFCTYDALHKLLHPWAHAAGFGKTWTDFVAGGIAGAASWLSIYPIDVVKSRMQATSHKDSPFRGFADCVRRSYNEGGLQVFVHGLGPTLARAFLVNAVIFTVYESANQAL